MPDLEQLPDVGEAKEHLGVYVGKATPAEVAEAIRNHSTGPVVEIVVRDGEVSVRHDWAHWVDALGFHADDDSPGRFVLTQREEWAHNPISKRTEVRPVAHGDDLLLPEDEVDRYLGGFGFDREDGSTVWLLLWHSSYSMLEDGDLAPGMGFRAEESD